MILMMAVTMVIWQLMLLRVIGIGCAMWPVGHVWEDSKKIVVPI